MILENLRSAADNIVDRVKNPFGGTLIAAWCIFNWRLVYSIFSFDDDFKLINRVAFIQAYIDETPFSILIWKPIWYSFIIIVTYLILTHISLGVFTLFQKWVTPSIYWLLDRNKITDKISYDSLKSKLIKSQKNYEEVRQDLILTKDLFTESRNEVIETQKKYELLNQDFESFKNKRIIFIENFEYDRWWSKDYWGKPNSTVCTITGGEMIFRISSSADLRNEPNLKGTGSYIDVIGGIFNGETYRISVKVRSEDNSTLKFKLWIHDTRSGMQSYSHPTRIDVEEQIIEHVYRANETNAIRVHLHIDEGIGILYLRQLKIIRIA